MESAYATTATSVPAVVTEHYALGKKLGEGAFAVVRIGIHKLTGEPVAVKIIRKAVVGQAWLDKMTREVKIMKALDHPNIVKLYEVIHMLVCALI